MRSSPSSRRVIFLGAAFLVVDAGCRLETEACVDRLGSDEDCSTQVCVALDPPIELTDATDTTAALVCSGCEGAAPAQYTLSAAIGELPPAQERPPPYMEVTLRLGAAWDRRFSAASLNAALLNNSAASSIRMIGVDQPSKGGPLQQTTYSVRRGSVVSARLSEGRVQMEIEAYLALATGLRSDPTGCDALSPCTCSWVNQPSDLSVPRLFRIELPYRAATLQSP
jgi:hypothetical protein